ncbi:MAG: ABC transporter permease [Ignavibacteriales bacterium]|nr:ABC transporter permease [Ignavibacteriales bacterium]
MPGTKFSEKIFDIFVLTILGILVFYFLALIFSQGAFFSFDRFFPILFSKEILFSLGLSFFTATIASLIANLVAIPSAYALSRYEFFGKDIIDTIIDIPILLSPVALGTLILMFFNTRAGTFIQNNFVDFVFSVKGIILAQFTVTVALAVKILKSVFDSINPRYESVARSLGSSRIRAFFKVTLPIAKNGIMTSFILTWARALGEFGASVMVAGAMKGKTDTLPIGIYLSLASFDLEKAVVLITILIFVSVVILMIFKKIIKKQGWHI